MNGSLRKLIKRGLVTEIDWMNFKINRDNRLTYHHINKVVDGGTKSKDNGAPLTKNAHSILNIMESKDTERYKHINQMLKIINLQDTDPELWQRKYIFFLIKSFINDKGRKHQKLAENMLCYEQLSFFCQGPIDALTCFEEKSDKRLSKVLQ